MSLMLLLLSFSGLYLSKLTNSGTVSRAVSDYCSFYSAMTLAMAFKPLTTEKFEQLLSFLTLFLTIACFIVNVTLGCSAYSSDMGLKLICLLHPTLCPPPHEVARRGGRRRRSRQVSQLPLGKSLTCIQLPSLSLPARGLGASVARLPAIVC